ncbi:MAG: peptide chain release factor N(5)-glutamine methyltransferase [Lachnospirales bacterium]
MTIQEALTYGRNFLKEHSISYDIDAKLLLMDILNINKVQLLTTTDNITHSNFSRYENYLNRRKNKEPIAYILNHIYFMNMKFYVNENVLIPRGDTEILVYKAIDEIKLKSFKKLLDIGTGSGCIPIAIGKSVNILSTAVDISTKALAVAIENAEYHNLKINFIESDLFTNINEKFDIITSNPPYITNSEMLELMDDVINFEPHLALEGGLDGLDFYRKICNEGIDYLENNGLLIFEIGYNQGEDLKNIMSLNFYDITLIKDLQGHDRVIFGYKKEI